MTRLTRGTTVNVGYELAHSRGVMGELIVYNEVSMISGNYDSCPQFRGVGRGVICDVHSKETATAKGFHWPWVDGALIYRVAIVAPDGRVLVGYVETYYVRAES